MGLPQNLRAPRSKPKNGLPLFLAVFSRLLSWRHGGATGVLLRVHSLCRRLRDSCLNWDCRLCLFCLSSAISLSTVYFLHYLHPTATVMARKKATADELDARTTANGYKRGYTGKKTVVDCNKHEDDTKKDQNEESGKSLASTVLSLLKDLSTFQYQSMRGYYRSIQLGFAAFQYLVCTISNFALKKIEVEWRSIRIGEAETTGRL